MEVSVNEQRIVNVGWNVGQYPWRPFEEEGGGK